MSNFGYHYFLGSIFTVSYENNPLELQARCFDDAIHSDLGVPIARYLPNRESLEAYLGSPYRRCGQLMRMPKIAVAKPGSGRGTVKNGTSGFGSIDCGADCTALYPQSNTPVTLTATPDAHSSFVGWADGPCVGQNSVCALTTNAATQTAAVYFRGAAIRAKGYTSLALKADGTAWRWGSPGALDRFPGFGNLIDINGSTDNSGDQYVALKGDGTVWTWGWNHYGQLGDGTTTDRHAPGQVLGLSGVIAITQGGGGYAMALKSDGTVWAWGYNPSGQLGDGTTTDRHAPVQVLGLSNVIAIASGSYHSLALKSDGTVWAWGSNYHNQLGNGTTDGIPSPTPTQVRFLDFVLSDVIAIATAGNHSLALKDNGTVWAWGNNGNGQLGDGTTTNGSFPKPVLGLGNVIAIATTDEHSLALKSDGTVWAWGYNGHGQLGDGTDTDRHAPGQVLGLSGVIAIASGDSHSLALKSDGTVWGWGSNYNYQLGEKDGNCIGIDCHVPIQVQIYGDDTGFLNLYQPTCKVTTVNDGYGYLDPQMRIVKCGATATFTVRTSSENDVKATGCGGKLNGSTYTTGPITGDCTISATFTSGSPGDINGDGGVNALDVVAVINAVLGTQSLPDADATGDGSVNALDVVFVINKVLGT